MLPTQITGLSATAPLGYTQATGSTTANGTLLTPGQTLNVQGGTLFGTGTVNGNVISSGTVAPGNSPGFLDITGNYTQTAAGTLSLEIAGRDPNVPQYDRLRVTGNASIDGTLHVDLLNDFQPAPGDTFEVITSRRS